MSHSSATIFSNSSISTARGLFKYRVNITVSKCGNNSCNNIYAIAQGPLLVGGFASAGAAGGGVQKNHPTVARIPGGATIEREIPFDFNQLDDLTLALDQPDFTTALRISKAINHELGTPIASALDAGTIKVDIPESYRDSMVNLVASLEQIKIHIQLIMKNQ